MRIDSHGIKLIVPIVLVQLLGSFTIIQAQSNEKKNAPDTKHAYEIGAPPGTYRVLSENLGDTIPFEFYRNKFRFKAQINGKDCNMMLDSGSLWDELLFFSSPKVDSIGFRFTDETSIGMTQADVDTNISIRVNNIIFDQQKAIVSRYESNRPNLWEGFDGQFSATFFKHFVVKINFDESNIELIPPEAFAYSGKGQELAMKAGPFNSRTIAAEVELFDRTATTVDLLVDLGWLHPLNLLIGGHEKITLPANAIAGGFGSGFFDQKGSVGRVKGIRLGKYVLKDVLTAFTMVDQKANVFGNSMLGLPLLQKFNVIFDYFNNRIILEPSNSYDEPFIFNTTGLEFAPDGHGNLIVRKVYPNSPASESNIEVNDLITHIDGIAIREFKPGEIKALLMNEGENIKLSIQRENQSRETRLKLEDIL